MSKFLPTVGVKTSRMNKLTQSPKVGSVTKKNKPASTAKKKMPVSYGGIKSSK